MTAIPNWHVGEQLMVGSGERFRILAINNEVDIDELEELYKRDINGI